MSGASVELRCDCIRKSTQAASRIEVFPCPFCPMKKFSGPSSTRSASKQRKVRSFSSASIAEQVARTRESRRNRECLRINASNLVEDVEIYFATAGKLAYFVRKFGR